MRLTLRTMLAYLDDVLEPADAADIGKKIEESEFAANIVHRTRDVMRRLRLGAPKLSGRGMGLDPNTVAEYLDNVLPDDRVPDFEKVCLESDVHLAEVASCHQILALVMGEPAEVDPESRQRMYQLTDRAASGAPTAPSHATPSHGMAVRETAKSPPQPAEPASLPKAELNGSRAEPSPRSERNKPEVPDYLRESSSGARLWQILLALAAVVVVAIVLVKALGIDSAFLAGLSGGSTEVAANGTSGVDNSQADNSQAGGSAEAADTPAVDATHADKPELQVPSDAAAPDNVIPPADKAPIEPPVPGAPGERATPAPAAGAAINNPINGNTTENIPADSGKPAAINPPVPAATDSTARPKPPAVVEPTPSPPATNPVPNKPAVEASAVSVGRLVSNNQVLLKFDVKTGVWQRIPAQQTLFAGDRLASLPSFRSSISFSTGITMEMLGRTIVELGGVEGEVPEIHLEQGRIVLLTAGKPDVQVRIQAGDKQALVTLGDPGSTMALEVLPLHAEGADPEKNPSPLAVGLYATSGKTVWAETSQPPQTIEGPARRTFVPDAPTVSDNKVPEWVSVDSVRATDKQAADFLAQAPELSVDRPTMLGLQELADHRRVEVRAISMQSLAFLGEFDPMIKALNDPNSTQAWLWQDLIEDLRNYVARNPDSAKRVRLALAKHRGDASAELYRMLWGYSAADLTDHAKKLVDYLDHNDFDFRCLSFWNLRNTTGMGLGYRPELSTEQRRSYVQTWKRRLESGQIVPKA